MPQEISSAYFSTGVRRQFIAAGNATNGGGGDECSVYIHSEQIQYSRIFIVDVYEFVQK